MNNWSETELAYLAGIIDGEGCFNINRTGALPRQDYNIRVYVMSVSINLIEWLQNTFGGYKYSRKFESPNWKMRHEWVLDRARLDILLPLLRPYLIIKREQLELAIHFRESFVPLKREKGKIIPLGTDVRVFRQECFNQMKVLNHKGPSDSD